MKKNGYSGICASNLPPLFLLVTLCFESRERDEITPREEDHCLTGHESGTL